MHVKISCVLDFILDILFWEFALLPVQNNPG